ncbi:MAG: M48 family metalloprotease, partial [Pseudomonadota bacterium]
MGNSSTANNSDMEELVSDMPKPSAAYKRSAGLAVAGLAIFVALYFALAGWFLLTVYRLSFGADHASKGAIWGYAIAVCALFLAVFMLKAIFFVKHGKPDGLIEVTAKNQPRLFAFLYQLADSAGAPRPHKVFLSARVNASVFYDLSLLNLFFPSKKNLEIGLALVNTLRHGELRAVLAHEFGHFAQRAMAVGRWAYMAQQIAAHLVARRDKLDRFLVQLSTIDIRIGWVGWILRAIVWSIRSLVESIFNMVLLMQRALSREMEMQADLVAVSLTGSDALVHALHRLNAADDAWSRTLHFVFSERGRGRATRDVFAVQSHIIERMGAILNDAHYGEVPPMPGNHADEHRVFKVEMAQPPKMWLSHPLNHEREANAKRYYVYAPINKDSAWSLFDHPAQLRAELSAKLINDSQATQVALEESLQELGRQFKREHLKSRYCGIYFGRSVVRCEADPAHLRSDSGDILATDFHFLYPESLKEDVQNLRALETECEQLEAIKAGVLSAPGGVLRVRGKELQLSDLPHAILQVKDDIEAVELRLRKHDRLCRTWHYAAAEKVGKGWPEYLDGLLAILHYADHTEANLRDAQGLFNNTLHMVSAARRVTAKGAARVLREAGQLYPLLAAVYVQSKDIKLDPKLLAKLKVGSWSEALGDFKFSHPTKENLNDWIKVIDSWVDAAAGACGALRSCALEQLLIAETAITVLHMRPER